MVDTIYIEQAVAEHSRTQQIVARYPKARQIFVEKYGEVFNPNNQNFRLQKNNPSLILAAKSQARIQATPAQYETGGGAHYYFSHMLNCVYDCRYCFLQGMYRSANYLVFVNYEDFIQDLIGLANQHKDNDKPTWFFSGYDCDSLAYEPVTRFAEQFVPAFSDVPNAVLELRTKSTQIRSLLNRPAQDNVVIAYSLSPQEVAQSVELGAPSLDKRVKALKELQRHGWRIGVRFDPVIWHQDYQTHYRTMLESVFGVLQADKIDSVTIGGFRLPKGFFKIMSKLHPEHWLFSGGLAECSGAQKGMVAYQEDIEQEALSFVESQTAKYIDKEKIYTYYNSVIEQMVDKQS